jgi:hypothetical protein
MKAIEILQGISKRMTKDEILAEVGRAKVELVLMDIHQVAGQLGGKVANVRARAINNGLGTMVGKMGRVYTSADVEALRRLIEGGPQPKTVALRAEMVALKESGLTNRAIAGKLGVDPSYVTKLLKS